MRLVVLLLANNHKYVIALISFYIIWKLCLHFEGIEINNYQGIN